ncbi:Ser-Thr-rich glycosyl-phosphatidyl-inositol-anchored membrane family-domain-containing protein [Aspergillus floccosus]
MRFFYLTLSAFAALAAAADNANPFNIPTEGYTFTAGKPTTLTWQPNTQGSVTLRLQWGSVLTPQSGSVIAQGIANSGSFTWTPPANLAAQPDYTIEIIDDSNTNEVNYLPRFTVAGATAVATHSAATTTSAATTSSTEASTSTESSTTSTASSKSHSHTTMATTTSSSSSSSTTESSSTASNTASTTTDSNASSTSSAAAETTVPNTNAGMANQVSGGLMVAMLGAFALL